MAGPAALPAKGRVFRASWRWLALLVAALVLLAIGYGWQESLRPAAAPTDEVAFGPLFGPADFAGTLAQADAQVLLGEERVANDPASWAYQESLARALAERATLTGSFADRVRATAAIDRALAIAPPGTGPRMTHAIIALQNHQLIRAGENLVAMERFAIPLDAAERAESDLMAGDIAFYQGRYAAAAERYDRAEAAAKSPGSAYRRALLAMRLGQFDSARGAFVQAASRARQPTRRFAANILTQIGALDLRQGRWEAARERFDAADRVFPGFWLTAVHRAQIDAAEGKLDAAADRYKAVLAAQEQAGEGVPEVMEALAAVEEARGNADEAQRWADRAGALWRDRLAALPEAAIGHATEHALRHGDPDRALELARRSFALRPYGDSALVLASALLVNGDPRAALDRLQSAEGQGWRSAELFALKAQAHADRAGAKAAREAALALNPRILDPGFALLFFGTH